MAAQIDDAVLGAGVEFDEHVLRLGTAICAVWLADEATTEDEAGALSRERVELFAIQQLAEYLSWR